MQQGYLCFIVGDFWWSNQCDKKLKELNQGKTQGVEFPKMENKLLIAQYANDNSFIMRVTHDYVSRVAHVLDFFGQTLCLQINDTKYMAF